MTTETHALTLTTGQWSELREALVELALDSRRYAGIAEQWEGSKSLIAAGFRREAELARLAYAETLNLN